MTEPTSKHTERAILKAAETTGLDVGTIAAALDPARFHEKLGEVADDAVAIRRILWLAPDEACRLAADARMRDLLLQRIDAARNLDELSEAAPEVPARLEGAVFARERSLVAGLEDAIDLCECFPSGTWQRASALGLLAEFVRVALATDDYEEVRDTYEQILNRLPDCGLDSQLGHRLEEIQLRDLAVVDDWGSALALLERPMPPDRPAVARLTIETAIRFASEPGDLMYIMEHGATKDHQDLNRKALLRILDLAAD